MSYYLNGYVFLSFSVLLSYIHISMIVDLFMLLCQQNDDAKFSLVNANKVALECYTSKGYYRVLKGCLN